MSSGKQSRVAHPRRPTAAERERRALAAAALVQRVVEEACNQGDLTVLDHLLAPPVAGALVHAGGGRPEPVPDAPLRERLPSLLVAFRAAVPDAHWSIVEQVAAGDTVVTRLSVDGVFSGPLVGLARPGRPATVTGVAISRFAAGRLVGLSVLADLLGLLTQLGVLPPLDLARTVAMAQVQCAGALLWDHPTPSRTASHESGGWAATSATHRHLKAKKGEQI